MTLSKEELQKIYDDSQILDRGKDMFSLKWVEKVMFWLIVAFASSITLALINAYFVHPIV